MLKKQYFYVAILLTLVMSQVSRMVAYADETPVPHDYIQEVGDKYIFVMLSTVAPSAYAGATRDENIRSKYNNSGLYSKGNSLIPIWTVDWYAFRVEISSDGKHLIRWELLSSYSEYDAIAFTLFENGQEIKEYAINELVAFPILLPSHFEWKEDSFFDKERKLLWIRTFNGEEYTIDITTGKIVKGTSPTVRIMFFALGVGLFILTIAFAARAFFKLIGFQRQI